MSEFKRVHAEELTADFVKKIGGEWALLTATKPDGSYNTMTVSWGGVGVLWNRPVCFLFVRPQRYTYEFTEAEGSITLSFFDKEHKDKLAFCGKASGRDVDKAKACGLTPTRAEGYTFFTEAREVLALKKLYADDLKEESFLTESIPAAIYEKKDYHKMYICEIIAAVRAV